MTAAAEDGSLLARAWRVHDREPADETAEYSVYSDTNFNGAVGRPSWPFDLLPDLGHRVGRGVAPAFAIRIRERVVQEVGGARPVLTTSSFDSYQGGGLADEIASLVSLALGVRCRSAGATRIWPRGGDPLGLMDSAEVTPWPTPRRTLLPHLPEVVDVNPAATALQTIPALAPWASLALARAATLFNDALWMADVDPNLASLLLVSAVEAAAETPQGAEERLAAFRHENPAVWECMSGAGLTDVFNQFVKFRGSTGRFTRFLMTHWPDPPAKRPEIGQAVVGTPKLRKQVIELIYEYRSKALHEGRPFPAPMCQPPVSWGGPIVNERPIAHAVTSGPTVWTEADYPMYFHTFAHYARGALVRWWQEDLCAPAQNADDGPPNGENDST